MKKLTKTDSFQLKTEQTIEQAKILFANEQFLDALYLFNAVLKIDSNNEYAKIKVAMCFMYLGKYRTAKEILLCLIKNNSNNAEVYFALAELYKLNFKYSIALTYIAKALEIENHSSKYLLMTCELCYLQKDYDEAFHFINLAIVQSPFKTELYYWRALIFTKFKNYSIAVQDINKALSINKHFADAYRLRAHCKLLMGDTNNYLHDIKLAQSITSTIGRRRYAA